LTLRPCNAAPARENAAMADGDGGEARGAGGSGPPLRPLVAIALLGLLPILALLPQALPQADDFCLADLWRRHGFWGGDRTLYETWTARLPLAFVMMAPAALAEQGLPLAAAYRLVLLAQLLVLLLLLGWTARLLLPGAPRSWRWGLALLLLFVLAGNLRTARDLLFWLGASGTYLPAGLALGLCFPLLLAPGRGSAAAALALAALAGVAVEFGGGGVALVALAAWLAGGGRRGAICLAAALLGLAGTLFLVTAPGNALRIAAGGQPGEPLRALLESLPLALQFNLMSQSSPGLPGLLLLAVLAGARGWVTPPPATSLWPVPLLALALPALAFALGLAGAGLVLPARAQVALQLALLPPLLWLALAWGARTGPRWALRRRAPTLALLLLLASPNLWVALAEQRAAQAYGAAGAARLAALAAPGAADQAVAPLPAYPALLHQEELHADPAQWINACAAAYFGRRTLRLDATRPPPDAVQPYWFLWPFVPGNAR
jgi:hypothetical protein